MLFSGEIPGIHNTIERTIAEDTLLRNRVKDEKRNSFMHAKRADILVNFVWQKQRKRLVRKGRCYSMNSKQLHSRKVPHID